MQAIDVLLVEDNAGDAVLIRQVLADIATPVHLHIARDGEQAVLMLTDSDFKPDLILLDLNIPRISGLALLDRWNSLDIPVVVFSSSVNELEQKRALALGARDFVAKPTDIQAFIDVVTGIIHTWARPNGGGTAAGHAHG